MCEYCGCQEIPAIAELTAEHDRLRELARELATAARAGDVVTAGAAARAMRDVLAPHTAVEEGALFPALEADYAEKIADLLHEHVSVDAVLAELAEGRLNEGWQARASEMVHVLFEHILKEQDGVFPASLTTLAAHDWDAVAEVRARVGSAVMSTAHRV